MGLVMNPRVSHMTTEVDVIDPKFECTPRCRQIGIAPVTVVGIGFEGEAQF